MNRKKYTTKHVQPIPRNVRLLLEELEYHSSSGAIITLIGESEQPYVIDLRKTSGEYVYGHHPAHKAQFISKLLQPGVGALVLRSFRDEEHDPETGLPIKELRGYTLMVRGDELQWNKINEEEMFLAQNTDCRTGEMLLPERAVRYR